MSGPFAELLLRHRTRAGLGQRELARRSGLSERAIRDLERGLRIPRTHSARLVAAALTLTGGDLAAFLAAARPDTAVSTPVPAPSPPPGDLVGRAEELRGLVDLVTGGRHRLVTITGRAGLGKSRIAAELTPLLAGRTDLTVRTIDLSAVREPALVGEQVAAALDCGPSRLPPVERVAAHLGDRTVVLVIDRFEHLVAAAAELAALVRRCPGLRLVVTSQRRLRLRDERVVALQPLSPADAAALFAQRAAATDPLFTVDSESAAAIATICRRVEHLPLAIELAAARVRLLHPVELAERLDRQLQVLGDGARDLPARHRSLRAAIEASLEVVGSGARTLFAWLGAFAGGGSLADVEAVATALGADRDWFLAALTELVDIDLVRARAEGGTTRYTQPDPMAELAVERLGARADGERVVRAVAEHFLSRVRAAFDGPTVDERDAPNIRDAATWATRHDPGMVDAVALGRFYETTGRLVEGQEILRRLAEAGCAPAWVRAGHLAALRGDLPAAVELGSRGLATAAADDRDVRVAALSLLAQAAVERGDPRAGRAHLRAALVQARRAGNVALLGRILNNLASVSIELGRPEHADRQMRAALEAKRRSGAGPVELGRTLFNLAEIALELGDNEAVATRAGEAVPLLRAGGFPRLAALAESAAALAALRRDDLTGARVAADRASQLLRSGDDRRTEAVVQLRRSLVQHAAGDLADARDTLRSALPNALAATVRDRDEAADILQTHAWYTARRDPETAAMLLGAADSLRRRPIPPPIAPLRAAVAAAARQVLGSGRYDERVRAGAALDHAGLHDLCGRLSR